MYRFGHNGLLKPEEIAHVVAYLLDPASDFNTKPALKR
jgi:sulfur-oxidizing protein SoxX